MLRDELVTVRRFCYLNGFYHMDLKELVNDDSKCIDAFILQAGALRLVLSIKVGNFKGEEYYIYRLASTCNYVYCGCTGSLETRDFKSIKSYFKACIREMMVDEDENVQQKEFAYTR